MRKFDFVIVTHVNHYKQGDSYYAYGPYIREMNLWLQQFTRILVVAPLNNKGITPIDLKYNKQVIFREVPPIQFISLKHALISSVKLPFVFYQVITAMRNSTHIHLRCPGNMGLLGALIQIWFPSKKKTAKYAGNWDPNSKQPISYRLQRCILSNTIVSKNITVLVYGNWPNQTSNIKSFFTASYDEMEKLEVIKSRLEKGLKLSFIGTLSPGKNPQLAIEVLQKLRSLGINTELSFCGEGILRDIIEKQISHIGLDSSAKVLGNVDADRVKTVLKESHFLVFLSDSEGWPKVVAESMWWGCIPVTKPVSCVSWMLGNGERGGLTDGIVENVVEYILDLIKDPEKYRETMVRAMAWSRQYTINRFEREIKLLC